MRCPETSHVASPQQNWMHAVAFQLLLGQRLAGTRSQEKSCQLPARNPMNTISKNIGCVSFFVFHEPERCIDVLLLLLVVINECNASWLIVKMHSLKTLGVVIHAAWRIESLEV